MLKVVLSVDLMIMRVKKTTKSSLSLVLERNSSLASHTRRNTIDLTSAYGNMWGALVMT